MFPSFVLALREGVEAALVIGLLLGALRKLQRSQLSASVWWGVAAAVLASLLVAVGLNLAGASLHDPLEAIYEGLTMLAAACLLTWMIFWMHRQSRFLRGSIEQDVRTALGKTSRWALFGVAFVAVVREGVELALFLVAAGLATNPGQELIGAIAGLVVSGVLAWLLFSSTRRLPLAKFFQVTNVVLILFAAGLVSHAVHEFNEVGWIPSVIPHIYDLNPLLPADSVPGQLLTALFGYSPAPSLTESLAYLVYFAVLVVSLIHFQRQPVTSAAQSKAS